MSTISCAKGGGFTSPSSSARFLLGEKNGLVGFEPGFEQVISVLPGEANDDTDKFDQIGKKIDEEAGSISNQASSSHSSSQVVVLMVSLHCKGCAGKVKKHISRMQGVTSFQVDFEAKKVTVVGDVTPVEVLSTISKVKTAKLWVPPNASSLPSTTPST